MARTAAPRCKKRQCKYVASQPSGLCRKHLIDECDSLFGKRIRARGHCELNSLPRSVKDLDIKFPACKGVLQCCHGFSRRHHTIRWNEMNSWSGCAAHHYFYTNHPDLWRDWLADRWGLAFYGVMQGMAYQTTVKVDLEGVYEELTR